jgi:hypothetical protein
VTNPVSSFVPSFDGRRMMASPWSSTDVEVAKQAYEASVKRLESYDKVACPQKYGRKGPHGRHDYRQAPFRAYAVDPSGSQFSDDALAYDEVWSRFLAERNVDVLGC